MTLTLTNKNGETLDLLNNDRYFILSGCDALHGIETDIATADAPYIDGSVIENVKALPRGITLTFTLKPDIAKSLNFFTNIVKSKQYVTLTQVESNKEITIKGIATIPPYTRMLALCKIQLTIYCSQPYWTDLETVSETISLLLPRLNFPQATGQYFTSTGRVFSVLNTDAEKSFLNNGDATVGMNIKIIALSEAENPRISCSTGEQNGFYMQLNLTLQVNDEVEINTVKGQKYIKINGSETYNNKPVLSYLEFKGTDWLQLETGNNNFNISPTDGSIYFTISYKRKWE